MRKVCPRSCVSVNKCEFVQPMSEAVCGGGVWVSQDLPTLGFRTRMLIHQIPGGCSIGRSKKAVNPD